MMTVRAMPGTSSGPRTLRDSPAMAARSAKKQSGADLAALLLELERRLMDPAFRRENAQAADLLAAEFVEFGASGRVWSREEILMPSQDSGPIVAVEDFAARMLAPGLAQATYRTVRSIANGQPQAALRSSLWIFREERWQMVFHQGTKIGERRLGTKIPDK